MTDYREILMWAADKAEGTPRTRSVIRQRVIGNEYSDLLHGQREVVLYHKPDGSYRVRLYLPAGEMVQNERVYAYVGPDESAARSAYDATVAKWDAMYASDGLQGVSVA